MNVVPLPVSNLNDIPAMIRKLADAIENGDHGEVDTCLVVLDHDTGITQFGFGDVNGRYHVIGLLETAKMGHISGDDE